MRRNRLRMLGAATVGAVALSATGLAGTAQADPVEDVSIIIDNLPEAIDVLLEGAPFRNGGLQPTLDAFLADQDFSDLGRDLGITSLDTVAALVQGTEQFGSLGLGMLLVTAGVVDVVTPYLEALDDPSTAPDLVNPDDLTTILDQLPDFTSWVDAELRIALVEAVQGNLAEDHFLAPGTGTPALLGNLLRAIGWGFQNELFDNTNLEDVGVLVNYLLVVAVGASGGYALQLEDALAPVFEALAPVTAPIVEALQGV